MRLTCLSAPRANAAVNVAAIRHTAGERLRRNKQALKGLSGKREADCNLLRLGCAASKTLFVKQYVSGMLPHFKAGV